jgi:hypothetical protein
MFMKSKQLMLINGSVTTLKDCLSQAGFVRDIVHHSTYRAELESPTGIYIFQIPYEEQDGTATLDGEAAFFDGISDSDVPEYIQRAALERWYALRSRIGNTESHTYSPERGDRLPSAPSTPSRPLESAKNGSMVQDFADLQRLGRDMERMKNGQQLHDEGLVDDPIQH